MALYFWSRPNYGSNGNPIVIYLPHSQCEFKEVLDCIMLAFHHTNIPDLIHRIENARCHHKFDDIFKSELCDQNDLGFRNIYDVEIIHKLYEIIQDSSRVYSESRDQIAKLLKWSKLYIEDVLKEFFHIYHQFFTHFQSFSE